MNENIQVKLAALKNSYLQRLPDKIAALDNEWQVILANYDKEKFKTFHRNVHSLCGSSGTYGLIELSQVFRKLEIYLKQRLDATALSDADKKEIAALFEDCKKLALCVPQV